MNPFEAARDMAGMWERSGEAYLRAQSHLLSGMTEWLGDQVAPDAAAGDEPGPAPRVEPPAATPLARAERAFGKTWATADDVSRTAMGNLAGLAEGWTDAEAAVVRRIFDPGAWFSGEPEGAGVRGGARHTDQGAEARIVAVLESWTELRRRSLEHNTLMLEAWMQAVGAFARDLATAADAPHGADALFERWASASGFALAEARRSDRFARSEDALLEAASRLRRAQAELGTFFGEIYGVPSRHEVDGLQQTVADLRREVRALQRLIRVSRSAPPGRQRA